MKNKILAALFIVLLGTVLFFWKSAQIVTAKPWPTATPTSTSAPTITPSITNTLTYKEAMATLAIRKLTPTVTPWPTATITLTPTSFLLPSFTPRSSIEASPTPPAMPISTSTIQPTMLPPIDNTTPEPQPEETSSTIALVFGLFTIVGVAGLLRLAYSNYRRKKMLYQIK